MVEYIDSSQNTAWHFTSNEELEQCRAYTNYRARLFLYQRDRQQIQQQQQQQQSIIIKEEESSEAVLSNNSCNNFMSVEKVGSEATQLDIVLSQQQQKIDSTSTATTIITPDTEPSSSSSMMTATTTTVTPSENSSIDEPIVWSSVTTTMINNLPISCYVSNKSERSAVTKDSSLNYIEMGPWCNSSSNTDNSINNNRYINPQQEMTLIDFYGSKISSMIGPNAEIKRLRRESKVVATAAIIYRRFYLSNSVLLYDPKIIMVASTFLACKIEDVTCDIRYIEQGTQLLNAPVTIHEIVTGEIILLSGINYNLLCYHPFKSTLALTEDLRTFLKTSIGQQAFTIRSSNSSSSSNQNDATSETTTTIISGQDLKPMYDQARTLLDLIIVSDLPLLYSPGQIGIAALTVAHNDIIKTKHVNDKSNHIPIPQDELCRVYLPSRFPNVDPTTLELLPSTIVCISDEIRNIQSKHFNITNHTEQYMTELKTIHKQLKKVRIWGSDSTKSNEKKKSKKRSATPTQPPAEVVSSMMDTNTDGERPKKRVKTE